MVGVGVERTILPYEYTFGVSREGTRVTPANTSMTPPPPPQIRLKVPQRRISTFGPFLVHKSLDLGKPPLPRPF